MNRHEQIRAIFHDAGLTFVDNPKLTDQPETIAETLEFKDEHVLAAKGIVSAIASLKKRGTIFKLLNELVTRKVRFAFVRFQTPYIGSSMMFASPDGFMLLNTDEDIPELMRLPPDKLGSYSAIEGRAFFDRTGNYEAAVEYLFKVTTFHEVGHILDFVTEGKLTGTAIHDLMPDKSIISRLGNIGDKLAWLNTNVSPYAIQSPLEMTAELFAMVMNGKELPPIFDDWKKNLFSPEERQREAA